ncbi:MAG: hypothetical protein KF729_26330 [Sandaracinaceae bacterium]|nr:hypothetical protein [Sandaracinaceae bacterium]
MDASRHGLACAALPTLALGLALAGCYDQHGAIPGADAGAGRADAGPTLLPDAGTPARRDAGARPDAGVAAPCDAEDAREDLCPAALCDGPGSIHWDGERCVLVDCGACIGEDCPRGWPSLEACEAAHASCEPVQCRATGGEWRFWAEECEHWECGRPQPVACILGRPVCDCGPRMRFDAAAGGCVMALCPEVEPRTRDQLCADTGGRWGPLCCHSECGQGCPDPCAAGACDCGPFRVFDEVRGCLEATRCFEPGVGEACDGRARCATGAICDPATGTCARPACTWP